MSDLLQHSDSTTCRSCRAEISTDSLFCPRCGASDPLGRADGTSDPWLAAVERALGSKYEIIRQLGRGGMGAVYLAREVALDRLVAVKALPPESADDTSIERFRREARIAAKLTHPNIVPLHAFGESDGVLFFIMGLVQGESLGAKLRRAGAQSPEDARRILGETAAALHYAHSQGVVHRDIKPDNILIDDESGRPMLTDFGIARSTVAGETLTQLGTAVGTLHYMSPEQAAGERDIDGRSDLYSLGVVGYQMLSGNLPFDGSSAREILVQHMTKEAPPLDASLDPDIVQVVSRCMAKEPGERPADGGQVQDALGITLDREEMPPELDWEVNHIRSVGLGTGIMCYLLVLTVAVNHLDAAIVQLFIDAVLMIALIAAYYEGRRRLPIVHPLREVVWWAFRKPKAWRQFWWPSRLRPTSDVWSRLPRIHKAYLAATTTVLVTAILGAPIIALNLSVDDPVGSAFRSVALTVMFTTMVPMFALFLALRVWSRRRGIENEVFQRLITAPDSSSRFWKRPEIMRLLDKDATPTVFGRIPQSSEEYLDAIIEVGRRVTAPAKSVVSGAVEAARRAVTELQHLDRQAEQLKRASDVSAIDDLEHRLANLGDVGADEPASQRRMRELLSEQLELARGVEVQLQTFQKRRIDLDNMVVNLWRTVRHLEESSSVPSNTDEASNEVRAAGDRIHEFLKETDDTVVLSEQ